MIVSPPKCFSRITSSDRVIDELEGLRFIAISAVFLHHLGGQLMRKRPDLTVNPALATLIWNGRFGVSLFFAISGFILSLRFARHYLANGTRVNLRAYFLRRVSRLEPPYIINQLVVFALLVVSGTAAIPLWPHLLATLTYCHNLLYGAPSVINGVGWSLEVEVQFYVLAPLMGKVFAIRSRSVRWVILLFAAIAAMYAQIHVSAGWLHFSFLGHLQYFLVGFLLADIYVSSSKMQADRSFSWDLVSVGAWASIITILCWQVPETMGGWSLSLPLLVFAAYYAGFRGRLSSTLLRNSWLMTFGGMCYTIYLYHFTLIIVLSRVTFRGAIFHSFLADYLIQICLLAPVVLSVSVLLFRYAERPFMRRNWPSELANRWKRPAMFAKAA